MAWMNRCRDWSGNIWDTVLLALAVEGCFGSLLALPFLITLLFGGC